MGRYRYKQRYNTTSSGKASLMSQFTITRVDKDLLNCLQNLSIIPPIYYLIIYIHQLYCSKNMLMNQDNLFLNSQSNLNQNHRTLKIKFKPHIQCVHLLLDFATNFSHQLLHQEYSHDYCPNLLDRVGQVGDQTRVDGYSMQCTGPIRAPRSNCSYSQNRNK